GQDASGYSDPPGARPGRGQDRTGAAEGRSGRWRGHVPDGSAVASNAGTGTAHLHQGSPLGEAAACSAGAGHRRLGSGIPGVAVVEEAMIKLLYKPAGILVSVLGGLLAGAIFKQAWKLAAHEDDAPKATDARRGWGEVL